MSEGERTEGLREEAERLRDERVESCPGCGAVLGTLPVTTRARRIWFPVRRALRVIAIGCWSAIGLGLGAGIFNLDDPTVYMLVGALIALVVAFGISYVLTGDKLWDRAQ